MIVVSIKPLDWREHTDGPGMSRHIGVKRCDGPYYSAALPWGDAQIHHAAGKFYLEERYRNREFESLDEAKAGAEADYQRRIMSALTIGASA